MTDLQDHALPRKDSDCGREGQSWDAPPPAPSSLLMCSDPWTELLHVLVKFKTAPGLFESTCWEKRSSFKSTTGLLTEFLTDNMVNKVTT